jgi:hypothetical protein
MKLHQFKLGFVFLFVLSLSGIYAQNIYVRNGNGTQTNYALSSIKKMTFSAGSLVVSSTAGADASYALKDLRYLNGKDLTLGLGNAKQDSQAIFIYPNPVTDVFYLAAAAQSISSIAIISMEGKVVLQTKKAGNTTAIDVSKLAKGLYLCKISTETTTQTIKFLKQ